MRLEQLQLADCDAMRTPAWWSCEAVFVSKNVGLQKQTFFSLIGCDWVLCFWDNSMLLQSGFCIFPEMWCWFAPYLLVRYVIICVSLAGFGR